MTLRTATTSFVAGELAIDLFGRSDTPIYKNGAARMLNLVPKAQGGAKTRPGLPYLTTLPALQVRLQRFVFNAAQRYVCCLSDQRIDIYLPDGSLAQSLTSMKWTAAQLERLTFAQWGDTLFVFHPSFVTQIIKRTGATSFTCSDYAFDVFDGELTMPFERYVAPTTDLIITFTSYPGGSTTWDVKRGYVRDTVVALETSASFFAAAYVGQRLRLLSGSQVEITAVTDGTHATGIVRSKSLSKKLISNAMRTTRDTKTVVASDAQHGYSASDVVFVSGANVIGVEDHWNAKEVNGAMTLTAAGADDWTFEINDSDTAHNSIDYGGGEIKTWSQTMQTRDWQEQAFSSVRGWPGCGEFFNGRLLLGGSLSKPSGFWASKINSFYNFGLGLAADTDGIWESVAIARLAEVRHIFSGRQLLICTDQGIVWLPTDEQRPLTPKNVQFREQAPYGVGPIAPISFDGSMIFLQNTRAIVREALYNYSQNAFTADPISLRSPHLIKQPVSMAAQAGNVDQAEQYAYLVNADGTMSVFHSVRKEEIAAWAPWETDGKFRQVCEVGNEVFVAVERTLGGAPTLTLEKIDSGRPPLDCSKRMTSGSPTRTFGGFSHLSGRTVEVISKRRPLGSFTVSGGGVITLPANLPEVSEIEAGFFTAPELTPMPVDADLPDGPARTLKKRLVRVMLELDDSLAAKLQNKDLMLTLKPDAYDEEPSGKTGVVEFRTFGISREAQVTVRITQPVSTHILALTREVAIGG